MHLQQEVENRHLEQQMDILVGTQTLQVQQHFAVLLVEVRCCLELGRNNREEQRQEDWKVEEERSTQDYECIGEVEYFEVLVFVSPIDRKYRRCCLYLQRQEEQLAAVVVGKGEER